MLRTHEYEFEPGITRRRPGDATNTARAWSREIVISSRGSGWIVVRDIGEDHPDAPNEFRLPYAPGTYRLELPLSWPTLGYEVVNEADTDEQGCRHVVRVALVRSADESSAPVAAAVPVGQGGVVVPFGRANGDDTSVIYIKNPLTQPDGVTANDPCAYKFGAAATFGTDNVLMPGDALPPIEVRDSLSIGFKTAAGATAAYLDIVKVMR